MQAHAQASRRRSTIQPQRALLTLRMTHAGPPYKMFCRGGLRCNGRGRLARRCRAAPHASHGARGCSCNGSRYQRPLVACSRGGAARDERASAETCPSPKFRAAHVAGKRERGLAGLSLVGLARVCELLRVLIVQRPKNAERSTDGTILQLLSGGTRASREREA